ncbi:MAG: 5'/3'-nucleotidase SurE [SAR202 cluster bacterium Io17-Chloro-G9]|nr:MAG: 5'/3'-nucleotidase SurE [SAR202 cluster bacterium Io17-Chloro-G9]
MKILLTNDDGIDAPGLWAAVRSLRQVGEVCVVAPLQQQSGVGAALTLYGPVEVREEPINPQLAGDGPDLFDVVAYSVDGTPADSCVVALEKVVGKVDLVVSGINAGSNTGWDVMVSGTVGAALQGYFRGYHTIAISVGGVRSPIFDGAARFVGLMAKRLDQRRDEPGMQDHLLLNVNVPNVALDKIAGLKVTTLGGRSYGESVTEQYGQAGEDKKRYQISRNVPMSINEVEGSDIWALKNNHVSITPLHISLAHLERLPEVETLVAGLSDQLLTAD